VRPDRPVCAAPGGGRPAGRDAAGRIGKPRPPKAKHKHYANVVVPGHSLFFFFSKQASATRGSPHTPSLSPAASRTWEHIRPQTQGLPPPPGAVSTGARRAWEGGAGGSVSVGGARAQTRGQALGIVVFLHPTRVVRTGPSARAPVRPHTRACRMRRAAWVGVRGRARPRGRR
jgi:hypothetical protein